MKRYTSRATKLLAIVALICGAVVLIGIILAFAGAKNIWLPFAFILLGGLLGIIFLACFLAEKSRVLIISAGQIILPRGAEINGKLVFQKTVVKTSEISSAETHSFKGDGLIAKDTDFYTLSLTNGRKITLTLYHYGKEAEKEIWETIKSSIV